MTSPIRAAAALLLACATSAVARESIAQDSVRQDTVTLASVRAHERFLTSDAMRGRGSATADEALAAAYVAAQFEAAGLVPVPGMTGYIQSAPVVRLRTTGPAVLTVGGTVIPGVRLASGGGPTVGGTLFVTNKASAKVARGAAVLFTGPADQRRAIFSAASKAGATMLLIVDENPAEDAPTRDVVRLADTPQRARMTMAFIPAAAIGTLVSGAPVTLTIPIAEEKAATTNAIGFLPGTDPTAKLLLLTAHLDHLGVQDDGIRAGANDNASGTVAVIELAKALASGPKLKRGVMFVAYGGEEAGLLGSRYFGEHPPVPLDTIAANVEFEMIGAQDPKLPRGALMMTGMERSDLGATMAAQGAKLAADPYPDQHFFERSDNYSLAVKGIVAHTLSGWATVPTYHTKDDNFASIDLIFMTDAIRSLVTPLRTLANSDVQPAWKPNGKPKE